MLGASRHRQSHHEKARVHIVIVLRIDWRASTCGKTNAPGSTFTRAWYHFYLARHTQVHVTIASNMSLRSLFNSPGGMAMCI